MNMNILECSSKGDKRFSAFYAKIKIFGNYDSIENHYQLSKRINNFKPSSWRDLKGKKPTHFEFCNKKIPLEMSNQFYDFLWLVFLDMNPFLRNYSSLFDDYNDVFKSKNAFVCQSDSIRKYHNDRDFLINSIGDFCDIMNFQKSNFKQKNALCFTGHRPNKLFGYNWDSEGNKKLMKEIAEYIVDYNKNFNVNTFITGGALGVDMMSFYIVQILKQKHDLNWKNILAIPFKNQGTNWNLNDVKKLKEFKKVANEVICVDEDKHSNYNNKLNGYGNYHISKMNKRNQFMVDCSDYVLGIWNGSNSGTKNCINYAKTNKKQIKIINPNNIKQISWRRFL